jgi:hypothetical protein
MDTKTVLKVIAMLDKRIARLNKEFDNPLLYGYHLDWIQGQIIGFREFKEHLRKLSIIHTELNKEA